MNELQKGISKADTSIIEILSRSPTGTGKKNTVSAGPDAVDEDAKELTFLQAVERATGIVCLRVHFDLCRIFLFGAQAKVERAKELIARKVDGLVAEMSRQPGNEVFVKDVGAFAGGFELQKPTTAHPGVGNARASDKFKSHFCEPPPSTPFAPHRKPIRVEARQDELQFNRLKLVVYVNCNWSMAFFREAFDVIASEVNCETSRSRVMTVLLAERGSRFTFSLHLENTHAWADAEAEHGKEQSHDGHFHKGQRKARGKSEHRKNEMQKGKQGKGKGKEEDQLAVTDTAKGEGRSMNGTHSVLFEWVEKIQNRISDVVVCKPTNVLSNDIPGTDFALILALAKEAHARSQFWTENFCENKQLMIQFSPTYDSFEELVGVTTGTGFTSRTADLVSLQKRYAVTDLACKGSSSEPGGEAKTNDEHLFAVADGDSAQDAAVRAKQELCHEFTRSELWRFCAILEELRKKHPSTLFVADFEVSCESDERYSAGTPSVHNEASFILASNKMRERLRSKRESDSSSLWLQSDHQRLTQAHAKQFGVRPVTGLSIAIFGFPPRNLDYRKAVSACEQAFASFFSTREDASLAVCIKRGEGREFKVCVMCRRVVEIWFGKSAGRKSEVIVASQETQRIQRTRGSRLTTCGCTYCRECFRAVALDAASNGKLIDCRNCNRQVLARDDCQAIMTPDFKEMKKDSSLRYLFQAHQREWIDLARAHERRYCAEILVNAEKYEGPRRCPDCGAFCVYSMRRNVVSFKKFSFFRCSTTSCPNEFCCRCQRVPITVEARAKCAAGTCEVLTD